ncbi:phosphopyruvate hydratase [Candidatus Woesearchaeota archaeon]|nr:phosphopyruvate hydratase [Candidatus Woesearchaeota archaeon]MBT3538401.1 phosphopyruvate hydratase [Candidatus Woesearchaeota archaeon]MBT4698362.1 phosphopyruvate hydratase [Candidatus Woesearchaeota archaeon]MBT4716394.1 phosphopyruvate hydratase [Candidatus Woesearchaeota archaeon]MBT7106070.1 phosphopyruvate hydratase [Candidatus Woesearchaeota archaeon]
MKYLVNDIKARQILDSRGNPTVEVDVKFGDVSARAAVPSGASTGEHEALELRDKKKEYLGKGVSKAVKNVDKIFKALKGKTMVSQVELDKFMIGFDGTPNKKRLGANAILGVSMASSRAFAKSMNVSLYEYVHKISNSSRMIMPVPFCNIINGGVHAGNALDFQEFMIAPVGAKSFSEATKMASETYHLLKDIIKKKYGQNATNVGDEGGFAPDVSNVGVALELIEEAISQSGYGKKIKVAMDAAASEFYDAKSGMYTIEGREIDGMDLMDLYKDLVKHFPLISIEDGFAEDDFHNWSLMFKELGDKVQLVGDDLLVTNPNRVRMAMKVGLCNALLLKVNQIGSVTEAIDAATLSMNRGWKVMVSHRSGETEDPYIADLAVGLGTGQIKLGAPCRSDRVAKYNQLLRIEEELGRSVKYGGIDFR